MKKLKKVIYLILAGLLLVGACVYFMPSLFHSEYDRKHPTQGTFGHPEHDTTSDSDITTHILMDTN